MKCSKRLLLFSVISILACTAGCGKKEARSTNSREESHTEISEETSEKSISDETYPETVSVYGVNEPGSHYFGIMHAVLLDIQKDAETGELLYTFLDDADPENAWAIPEIEIGSVNADVKKGNEFVLLFNGDIINDSENVSFIAILPEDDYRIRRAEGTTTSNVMSSFKLKTKEGKEISFIKDNCLMEDGVMQESGGEEIVVYYAEGLEAGVNYPLKIYLR